jgi:integrase
MRVCYSNRRLKYYVSEKINPKYWETEKGKNFQRAKRGKAFPGHVELNARLDNIETRVVNIIRRYRNDNSQLPDESTLKNLLDIEFSRKVQLEKGFWSFFGKFIAESESGVRGHHATGEPISLNTVKTYKTAYRHLKNFETRHRFKVEFHKVTLEFYGAFKEYLQNDVKLSINAIGKYIKILKTVLNEAIEHGVSSNIAHRGKKFIVPREQTTNIYLNEEELLELLNIDFTGSPKLDRVRDLFLVGCYTGLRLSDWSAIQKENISDNKYLTVKTQKTGESVVIPLHPIVKQILHKYNYNLPKVPSEQKVNQYLKDVVSRCKSLKEMVSRQLTKAGLLMTQKLEKWHLVSSHTARRSFATNLYLQGFPPISIMKITGHKTEAAFLTYIKITPNESAKQLEEHWERITNYKANLA